MDLDCSNNIFRITNIDKINRKSDCRVGQTFACIQIEVKDKNGRVRFILRSFSVCSFQYMLGFYQLWNVSLFKDINKNVKQQNFGQGQGQDYWDKVIFFIKMGIS
eukprot:TRINITY_DN2577_c2_g1_i2.p9 TRINITY_DN2577_c2_g1~~TRINITY_DN2577_c2_g1_i2.p9  ORF type:complete len:105 (+),score=2.65 TRINITY_DN2577_c2_g1_i2:1156-1470(+)